MGWTTSFTANHWKAVKGRLTVDRKKCVDELCTFTGKDKDGKIVSTTRVLKSAMRGAVWYGACETVKADGSRTVWAGICLTCGRSGYDGTVWGYKEMDESMHPFYYDCPTSILALLSPTDDKSANEWREECLKHNGKRKASKLLTLPQGVTANYRGRRWVVSSPEYRAKNYYSGVGYGAKDKIDAVNTFISQYGTDSQKAEWEKAKATAA